MAWTLDGSHSGVEFSVKHMVFSKTKGAFRTFKAEADINEADLTASKAKFVIETASIDTRDENRDNHLRSGDFFDSANHPEMVFESRSIKSKGNGEFVIAGDLTIRGVTKPIELATEVTGPEKDPFGGVRVGVSAQAEINRKDWGLVWNGLAETGGILVGDNVKMQIEAEFVKAD